MPILAIAGQEVRPGVEEAEAFRQAALVALAARGSEISEGGWAGHSGLPTLTGKISLGFLRKADVTIGRRADDGFIVMQVTDWSRDGVAALLRYRDGEPVLLAKGEAEAKAWNEAVRALGI